MVAQNTLFSAWKTSKIALFEVLFCQDSVAESCWNYYPWLCCRHNECHSAENTLHVRVATKLLRKICTDICCEEMFFDFINPAGSCHQEFMIFAGELSIIIGKLSRFYDLDSILLKYLMNV